MKKAGEMKMTLIDKDELMKEVQKTITEQSGTIDWLNLIHRQPIAYDVDNVVEQIIEKLNKKKSYFQGFYECEGKTKHDAELNKATQLAFDDAIEIVKCYGIG